jgi:hypothetical protein
MSRKRGVRRPPRWLIGGITVLVIAGLVAPAIFVILWWT